MIALWLSSARRPRADRVVLLGLLWAAAWGPACDSCTPGDGPVPFGVDAGSRAQTPPDPDPRAEPTVPVDALESQTFPEGTSRIAIEGAPIAVEGASIRALLALDLDDDGDRDALVATSSESSIAIAVVHRQGASFDAPTELANLSTADGCSLSSVSLRTVPPSIAVASIDRACPPASVVKTVWVISLSAVPRLRERLTLLPPEGRTAADVSIALRSADHDGDGHADMVLDVSVTPEGGAIPATASIAWLDRPGGLARDTREPEATLAALALHARQALDRDAASALSDAERALALHAALCREGPGPRVRFGDADGLPCRESAGAGRAAAVAAAALARGGHVFAALAAMERLSDPAYRVTAEDRRMSDRAIAAIPTVEATVIAGPSVPTGVPGPATRLPMLGFLDEDRLLVRAGAGSMVDLSSGAAVAGPVAAGEDVGPLIRDPSGRFAVTAVRRSCEGHTLTIVRASEVVAGVVAGRPVSEPLLEPRAPPSQAACPSLPEPVRAQNGGWQVVGWAPQGVVAVRRDAIRIVPLDVEARPVGEPVLLEGSAVPPAPLPAGAMTRDGRAYVLSTAAGIVLRRLGETEQVLVVRPDGWSGERPGEVAISPSGRRVAFVSAGRTRVLTLAE